MSVLVIIWHILPDIKREDFTKISLSNVKVVFATKQKSPQKVKRQDNALKKKAVKNSSRKEKAVKEKAKKRSQKRPKSVIKNPSKAQKTFKRKEKKNVPQNPPVKEEKSNPTRALQEERAEGVHNQAQFPELPEKSYEEIYKEENLFAIREAILSYLKYPPIARRMGWEGVVWVRFTILPDGTLQDSRVEKSSGYKILDRSAIRAVELAHKHFPKPTQRVTIVVPVVYRLE